ncbi:Phage-related protein [Lachnospira eligens]|uniref:Phage-related protein n=1 Tax=Lachnospira eligens TaxID=39485 RepID=A0A174Z2D8_9FIRM|nr:tape measure protein [Lachnospira eligens]CUQ77060.1 Phage-related protein [Lachnospira eligens]
MSSKEVDERVVEMRFDNAQFEKNVQTSMSTLDKLKAKLNFNGVSKGLEDVGNAAKKLEFSGVTSGIETVQAKLSAMEVIGVTALANITNSAVNAGKRIASAITIDPVRDGFNEYETQMNAVQTILANTQKEGTNVKQVNAALDQLNTYADKTIYNFTEMTRNIGTFTAAGVKLDTSVSAIQGIANLAAVSGSTSQQASTAMYQLSQALASGTVKLMDWNSVVNAGMGGQVFQDALIRTSEKLGTGAQAYIDAAGSFRESLSKGWLTTDVLTETLDMFSTAADTEEEYAAAIQKFVDEGYSEEQAVDMANMAKTAGEAATKVKTFTQLIDTLKEALGSGWTTTWRLIIGDFEEAKELWTNVSDVLSKLINNASEARNKLVEGVMSFNPFTNMLNKLENSDVGKTVKQINNLTNSLEYYQKVVTDVWRGNYKNSDTGRYELLDEAGYNHQVIQDLVNKGYEYELTVEDVQEAETKFADSLGDSTEEIQNESKQLVKLSDEQLRNAGLTDDEISMYRDLEKQSEKTGKSIEELINDMSAKDGRTLLWDGLGNIGETLIITFTAIKDAFSEIFPAPSVAKIYGVIDGFNALTEKMKEFSSTHAYDVEQTFKGLFAVIDIVRMVLSSGLTVAFKALKGILSAFDIDIIEFTGYIGEALVNLRNWLKNNDCIEKSFKKVGEGLKIVIDGIKKLLDYLGESPKIQKFIDTIKNIDLSEAGEFIIAGLKKGLSIGLSIIPDTMKEIADKLLSKFREVLGIHSPSKETEADGEYLVEGLINGIKNSSSKVWDTIKTFGSDILEKFKELKLGDSISKIVSVGAGAGMLVIAKKLADAVNRLTSPLKVMESVSEAVEDVGKAVSKNLKASALEKKTKAIQNVALAALMLAGAVFIFSKVDPDRLWQSVGVMAALTAVLAGIAIAMDKFSKSAVEFDGNSKSFSLNGLKTTMLNLGIALILMAATTKILGSMNPDQLEQGLIGLSAVTVAMIGLIFSLGKISESGSDKAIKNAGKTMKKLAVTMLLMVAGIAILGNMNADKYKQGIDGFTNIILALMFMVTGLVALTHLATNKDISQIGNLMLKISASMLLMVIVAKMAGELKPEAFKNGAKIAGAVALMVTGLVALTHLATDKELKGVGRLLLSVSLCMAIMAGVCLVLGLLRSEKLEHGVAAIVVFGVVIGALIKVVASAKKIDKNAGGAILAIAVTIAVMAAAVTVLSLLKPEKIAGATVCLGILIGLFALVERNASYIKKATGSLIVMAVIIGLLGGLLIGISFIPTERALVAAGAISLVLLSLSGAMYLIGKAGNISIKAVAALAMMAVVVLSLAALIQVLTSFNVDASLMGSLLLLAGCLISIGAAVMVMNNCVAGAAALVVVALALSVFLPVLQQLGSMSLGEIGVALLALAGSLAVLGLAGLLLGPVVAPMIGIAGAIALLGVGCLGAGAGLQMFAQGLTTLVMLGPVAIQAFTATIQAFITLIPTIITTIVTSLVTTFTTCIPMIVEGALLLITSLLTSIAEHLPEILAAGISIIMTLLTGIRDNIGQITEVVIDIIINFAEAIANKLPDIIQCGVDVFFAFLDGFSDAIANNGERLRESLKKLVDSIITGIKGFLGIHSPSTEFEEIGEFSIAGLIKGFGNKVGDAVEAVGKLASKLVGKVKEKFSDMKEKGQQLCQKIKDGFEEKAPKIVSCVGDTMKKAGKKIQEAKNDFKTWGKDAMEGLRNGMESAKDKIKSTVGGIATDIGAKFKDVLGIHSPSRVFKQYGKYIDLGLVNGIKTFSSKVYDTAKSVGSDTIDGMSSAISKISELINGDMDMQPTIRPVVDLSDVQTGVGAIAAMMPTGGTIGISGGFNTVATMMNRNRQNGNNDEVISAINKLDKSLNGLSKPIYNVGGITYDDGSAVSDAVQELIRAARIDRRS